MVNLKDNSKYRIVREFIGFGCNALICGRMGSGKTATLENLKNDIPGITIFDEDGSYLQFDKDAIRKPFVASICCNNPADALKTFAQRYDLTEEEVEEIFDYVIETQYKEKNENDQYRMKAVYREI